MIIYTFVTFIIMSILGGFLCIWFGTEARPAVRWIHDASHWTKWFALFFYLSSIFTFVYSIIAEIIAGNMKTEFSYSFRAWLINECILTVIGIIVAVIFFIVIQSKNSTISIVASSAIFLQGFIIYFVGTIPAPSSFGTYHLFSYFKK